MNPFHMIFRLLPTALLLIPACSKDTTTPADPAPVPTTITLSMSEIALATGGSTLLRVTVEPAEAGIKAADLVLVDAQTSKAPASISMQYIGAHNDGSFSMSILDKGVNRKYTELVKIICPKVEGLCSQTLTVNSAPYMPVVRLTAQQPVESKDIWVAGTLEIDGGKTFEDLESMTIEVKGRGNTTWGWEKKPYALKLKSKKSVLGMPKHKRWCLIANYMDRTQLRNRVAYHIGQNSRLAWTVRNEYVEFYMDGEYRGLFLLTEQIKEDPNRVDITEMTPSDNDGEAVTGGYLLELDGYFDEEKKFRSASTSLPVNIKYPDPEELTQQQFDYIQNYFNTADAAVAGGAGNMFDYFDKESLIDYWIISEVTANHEPLNPKSTYFFKDRGGKLTAGPIWDFDYETLVSHTQTQWMLYDKPRQMMNNQLSWWYIFLQNKDFRTAAKKRFQEWYPFLTTVPAFIDAEQKAIADAVVRNNVRWPRIEGTNNVNRDESLTFNQAVARIKSVYSARLAWMNSEIAKW